MLRNGILLVLAPVASLTLCELDPVQSCVGRGVQREKDLVDRLSAFFGSLGVGTLYFAPRMAEAIERGEKLLLRAAGPS